jgi:hypothetical protein
MTWVVELGGDASDLSALAKSLTDGDVVVSYDGNKYSLTSGLLETIDDAKAVHEKAKDIVSMLNGACRLAMDAADTISVDGLRRHGDNGSVEVYAFTSDTLILGGSFSGTVTHPDGTREDFHPADPVKQWAAIALTNDAVANVLRILSGGPLDWVNLYRMLEIVEHDVGGLTTIYSKGWATKASVKLFMRTAGHPGAVGLEARHGASNTLPPPKPMPISEAKALLKSIIHAWLRAK